MVSPCGGSRWSNNVAGGAARKRESAASGDALALIDSDDAWKSDRLRRVGDPFEAAYGCVSMLARGSGRRQVSA
jgi:hypothetical protein